MAGDLVFGAGGWVLLGAGAVQLIALLRGSRSAAGVPTAGVLILSMTGAVTLLVGSSLLWSALWRLI